MAKPDERKLPKPTRALLACLKAGAVLCKEVAATTAEAKQGGFIWFVYPTGVRVAKDQAESLLKLGFVEPGGDSLIPGDGQTFRPAGVRYKNG
ncbi:hypothetical protein NKJ26_03160 [Mesorhizobium sp. M0152]|uniref:hypothetical protein n=1 Tax=Mesorhizobium sp. M0152 TaxID=2956898 RepID=UPI0033391308